MTRGTRLARSGATSTALPRSPLAIAASARGTAASSSGTPATYQRPGCSRPSERTAATTQRAHTSASAGLPRPTSASRPTAKTRVPVTRPSRMTVTAV